jgi:lantibiotic biosynthesis protein
VGDGVSTAMAAEGRARPIFDPALAARARATARAVGEALRDPPAAARDAGAEADDVPSEGTRLPWNRAGLAGGHPGMALLAASLAETFPGEGWDRVAHGHLAAATGDASILGLLDASLHSGWGGLCFAAHLLSRGGRRYGAFLATADERLCAGARRLAAEVAGSRPPIPPHRVDLIGGLSGIAVALLARRGRPATDEALGVTLAALVALSGRDDGVPRFASPPDWGTRLLRDVQGPVVNLGLAHGIPGPLAALALAHLDGARAPGDDRAIEALAGALVAARCEDAHGVAWPCAIAVRTEERSPPVPARMAWCYGAPGCARALWLAGEALGCREWKRIALDAIHAAIRRPAERRGLPSATYCHGRAGLFHIALLFARDTGDAELAAFLPPALDRLVRDHDAAGRFGYARLDSRGRSVADPGLLDGAAGVGMVLLAAASTSPCAWGRAFLVG